MPTTPDPIPTDLHLLPEVDARTNPCPECHTGEVITTGFLNPAATQAYCSDACGWTA